LSLFTVFHLSTFSLGYSCTCS